eukprot:gene12806-7076_t
MVGVKKDIEECQMNISDINSHITNQIRIAEEELDSKKISYALLDSYDFDEDIHKEYEKMEIESRNKK